jgi:Fur family peroxide stress response transcriptional regulator
MNKQGNLNAFTKRFKDNNLRVTPQRTAILKEIINDRTHPTVDNIFQRIHQKYPNISFDTVNRTLSSFSEAGLLKVVEGYGNPKRYDSDTSSHHHFRCLKCNRIIDFKNKNFDDIELPPDISKRFTVLHKKVVLEGICDKCAKKLIINL